MPRGHEEGGVWDSEFSTPIEFPGEAIGPEEDFVEGAEDEDKFHRQLEEVDNLYRGPADTGLIGTDEVGERRPREHIVTRPGKDLDPEVLIEDLISPSEEARRRFRETSDAITDAQRRAATDGPRGPIAARGLKLGTRATYPVVSHTGPTSRTLRDLLPSPTDPAEIAADAAEATREHATDARSWQDESSHVRPMHTPFN